MELINLTGFATERYLTVDGQGCEVLLVIVKATFRIVPPTTLEPADPIEPICPVDAYLGEPGASSLAASGEAAAFKPNTDILLSGCAYPNPREPSHALTGFRLGPITKLVRVLGDRRWERRLSVWQPSPPARFEKMPLVYERAFGGVDMSDPRAPESCAENPVGVGLRSRRNQSELAGQPLPNLEDPQDPITSPGQRVRPFGLGPIAPSWEPRVSLAGTYDAAWRARRLPLPPSDLDPRYHQAAPPDQIRAGYLHGGEVIEIFGMAAEGNVHFTIPSLRPEVVVRILEQRETPAALCDTLTIDMEKRTLCMVWRASLVVQGRVDGIMWIKVQPGR